MMVSTPPPKQGRDNSHSTPPSNKKSDEPTPQQRSPRKVGSSSSHQSSAKLYKFLMIITAFGFLSFLLAIMTDTNGHLDEEHIRKELILKAFLNKEEEPKEEAVARTKQSNEVEQHQEPAREETDHPPYHVVFSTSCNDQQHWESYVFFYHAYKVKQPGTVTRIVSGCKKEEATWLREFHANHIATLNSNFFLHTTPDFSRLTQFQGLGDKSAYKYMNKPYGLRDWMEKILKMDKHDRHPEVEDGIVILMDPDNILLRPIGHEFAKEDVVYAKGNKPDWTVVEHGHPIAQQDGYLNNQWMELNISFVTHGGDIDGIKGKDGPLYWNTGPPYLATVRDMYNIAVLWTEYAPRVYHIHPKLFAEMYGYIIATTQLKLPHTLIKSIVVSTTGSVAREGWEYIDALPDNEVCDLRPGTPLPIGLHYCKRYLLEKWFFSKYRLKKKYISCETPLLASPPLDLAERGYTYSLQPPPHGHKGEWEPPRSELKPRQAKREAFMICNLIKLINEAAIHYKTTACNGTANMSNNYTFFSDPNH